MHWVPAPANWILAVLTLSDVRAALLTRPRAHRSNEHLHNFSIAFKVVVLTTPWLSRLLLGKSSLSHLLLWPCLSVLGSLAATVSATSSFLFLVIFELVTIIIGYRMMAKQKMVIYTTVSQVALLIVFHIYFLFLQLLLVYSVCYLCLPKAYPGYQGFLGSSPHLPFQCLDEGACQS